jgi:hypothetical protein
MIGIFWLREIVVMGGPLVWYCKTDQITNLYKSGFLVVSEVAEPRGESNHRGNMGNTL